MAVVGVDVGGTFVRAVVYDDYTPVANASGPSAGGQAMTDVVAAMIEGLEARSGHRIEAVGVGVPGQVDQVLGTVRHAVNLGIDGGPVPIGPALSDRFGVPVVIENDVRAAAVGALTHLQAEDEAVSDLVYLGIGTGISAGVVINGELHRGHRGLAGEIGHLPLGAAGSHCRCGLDGCIEAVAAGPAVITRWPGGAASLFAAAAEGDKEAVIPAREIAEKLTRVVHVVSAAYDPDMVVLGGGVGTSGAALVRAITEQMSVLAAASPFAGALLDPRRISALPDHVSVGTIGAAVLARRTLTEATAGAMALRDTGVQAIRATPEQQGGRE